MAAFKDEISEVAVEKIALRLARVSPTFDRAKFVRLATDGLDDLELKARVRFVADALRKTLPEGYSEALSVILAALPAPLVDTEVLSGGWEYWPFLTFVEVYGIDDFDSSLLALREMTMRFTAEFAIRPYFLKDARRTLNAVASWKNDENPHVRRLCSEGLRPRLPWGLRLQPLVVDPTPCVPLLMALADDDELYVRRSVANHINDISKDHPKQAVDICTEILARGATKSRRQLVSHALRTLVKAGDVNALALLGFGPPRDLVVSLRLPCDNVAIGGGLEMELEIGSSAESNQTLSIDYAMYFQKKSNGLSRKVFKWKRVELAPTAKQVLTKVHPFRETSVRSLYAGAHRVEILVNGSVYAEREFSVRR